MGKTVPSYRITLETEIGRWSGYGRALRFPEREAFVELMDMCRSFASAGGNATNPIVFEPMAMSIMLAQQMRIRELETKVKEIMQTRNGGSSP